MLHEPAYDKVGGNNASPWTKGSPREPSDGCAWSANGSAAAGSAPLTADGTARLLVARYPVVGVGEAAPGEAGSGVWMLAAFAQPVGAEAMTGSLGMIGGVGATHCNLYMPHWKTLG